MASDSTFVSGAAQECCELERAGGTEMCHGGGLCGRDVGVQWVPGVGWQQKHKDMQKLMAASQMGNIFKCVF